MFKYSFKLPSSCQTHHSLQYSQKLPANSRTKLNSILFIFKLQRENKATKSSQFNQKLFLFLRFSLKFSKIHSLGPKSITEKIQLVQCNCTMCTVIQTKLHTELRVERSGFDTWPGARSGPEAIVISKLNVKEQRSGFWHPNYSILFIQLSDSFTVQLLKLLKPSS